MLISTNNLIMPATSAPKKTTITQGTGMDSGGFQALLAILLNQSMNFPGNDASSLQGGLMQDGGMETDNLGLLNILGSGGILKSPGIDNLGDDIKSLMGSSFEGGQGNIQDILSGLIPSLLSSATSTGASMQSFPIAENSTSNTQALSTMALLSEIIPESILSGKSDNPVSDSIFKLLNQEDISKADANNITGSDAKDSKVQQITGFDASGKIQGTDLNGIPKPAPMETVQVKMTEPIPENEGIKDNKTQAENQMNPSQIAQKNDKDYIVQRPDLLKILKLDGASKTETGAQLSNAGQEAKAQEVNQLPGVSHEVKAQLSTQLSGVNQEAKTAAGGQTLEVSQKPKDENLTGLTSDIGAKDKNSTVQSFDVFRTLRVDGNMKSEAGLGGNTSGKDSSEKNDSGIGHKAADKKEALKLEDFTVKAQDKPQEIVNGFTEAKGTQGNTAGHVHAGTEQAGAVNKDDILNQIYDKIKVTNTKDLSELHLNLKPEELGEVSIKLVMEKGMMTGRILVENSHVKSLIESNLPQIKDSLKAQNPNVSEFSVSVGLKQEGQQFNQNFSQNRWMQQRGSYFRGNRQEAVDEVKPRIMNMGAVNILA